MVVPPETTLPFLSYEPKAGDTSCQWQNFDAPKLRKFPKASSLRWRQRKGFIGAGEDGLVLRARIDDNKEVAVKIFYHNKRPEQPEGGIRYWPFERECSNCAILELISTSLREGASSNSPFFLHPRPKTRKDSIRNLKAFSREYRAEHPPGFQRFAPIVHINHCLGWTQLDGDQVWSLLEKIRAGPCPGLTRLPWYFAIVYTFVPEGSPNEDVIQSHLDFFYLAGFVCVPVKLDNWRGAGTLVDFSDLVPPHAPEWQQFRYGRMVKKDSGRYDLEYPNRKGEANPRNGEEC